METIEQLKKRLFNVVGDLENGKDAAIAAAVPVDDPPPVSKDLGNDPFEQQFKRFGDNSLAKSFLTLAKAEKQFRHLGDDKVLENPRHYLRKKHGEDAPEALRGKYQVQDDEIEAIIGTLLLKGQGKEGVGLHDWMSNSPTGYGKTAMGLQKAAQDNLFGRNSEGVQKALDASSGSVLIRTDIEPVLYEVFLRRFPAAEVIRRIPANGIVHTYNRRTATGAAVTISDLGDMSGSVVNSTLGQSQNSHIATIISPRAIGLKLQYAVQQSGMNFGIEGNSNLELVAAMYAIANKLQTLVLQGNSSTGSKTLDDEDGLTDANGFDGLRTLLKGGSTSINKATSDAFVDTINKAVGQIMNAGGDVNNLLVFMSIAVRFALNLELQQFMRVTNKTPSGGFDTGLSANGIVTLGEWLTKIMNIPSASQSVGMGYYTYSSVVTEDIDVIDPMTLALAYLGSPTPVVLELPIGFNHQLSNVYYPFLMNGLVFYTPEFGRKVRVPQQSL
ncbi:MAG: hypothetical protein HY231_23770 [Acidobacteria bacterium]|nr:hypothetical protein [Acidobacteriota bacterium]